MDKFFNSDNMVMRTLSKIFDIGWLTLIYLVFCIPIVTVGAATTSLYYVVPKCCATTAVMYGVSSGTVLRQTFCSPQLRGL